MQLYRDEGNVLITESGEMSAEQPQMSHLKGITSNDAELDGCNQEQASPWARIELG